MNKYKLIITGRSTNIFFNKLINLHIKLYYIEKSYNKLIIIVDKDDYKKIIDIKTSCDIKIINRFGIVKYKYLIYKYRFLLLSFLINIIFLLFLSNIIFSVDVIHSNLDLKDTIYNDLEKYGIKKYSFILSFKKKEIIKNKILKKEKDKLEWIEIDRIGTKYIINLEEKKLKKEEIINKPRDIISKKDCMILEINAKDGEIVKKKYDYVKKGDVIVSGTILNKSREVKKISAEGKVYGEVWYKVSVEIPINYKKTTFTGKTKKTLSLVFLDHIYSLELKRYKNYSFNELKLLQNNLLPIKLVVLDKKEVIYDNKVYNISNVDSKALELSRSKFKNKEIILEKVLKKRLNKSTIIVDVFYKVKEDVTDYREIKDLELKENIDE